MKRLTWILMGALALALSACGGRASLDPSSGRSFKLAWQAQAASRPSPPLDTMAAADAKTAMYNHEALYNHSGNTDGGSSSMGLGGTSGQGSIVPSTTDFSASSPSVDRSGIRLEAR